MGRRPLFLVLFAVKFVSSAAVKHPPDSCTQSLHNSSVPRCNQICVHDEDGQARCSCTQGYQLADDGHICIVQGDEPVLLYSSGSELHSYYVDSLMDICIFENGANISAFAFGVDKQVFLADATALSVYSIQLDDPTTQKTFVDTGLYSVSSMAVDLPIGNLYIVDSTQGRLLGCSTRGRGQCAVVLENLKTPHSVIVDKISRHLIWSEAGNGEVLGSISMAGMEGSERQILVDRLVQPSALALDAIFNELYWMAGSTDADHVIKAMKLDGSRQIRNVFTMKNFQKPTFSLLSDTIYITEGRHAVQVNKWNSQVMPLFDRQAGIISSSSIYHPVLCKLTKEETSSNACESDPCSHICVTNSKQEPKGFSCLCPPGLKLDKESKQNCISDDNSEVLMVSGLKGLFKVPVDYVGPASERTESLDTGDIDVIVHEVNSRRVIYHHADEKAIKVIDVNNPRQKKVLHSGVDGVEGMAVDVSTHALYWTNKHGEITVGKLDGTMSKVIVTGLGRIRGITLDSAAGLMYICEWGDNSRIIKCNMDGQACVTLVTIPGGHPNDIVMDVRDMGIIIDPRGHSFKLKTLFWTDSKQDIVTVWPLEIVGKQHVFPLLGYRNPHPYAMSLSDDYLYFSDLNTGHLHFMEMPDSHTHLSGTVQNISLGLGSLYGLAVVRRNKKVSESTGCSVINGGCSHICLVGAPSRDRTCLCPDDLELTPDGTTCTVDGLPATPSSRLTTPPLIVTGSGPHPQNAEVMSHTTPDKLVLTLVLSSCVTVTLVVVIGIIVCFNKNKRQQSKLISRLVRYARRRSSDDHEKLCDDDHTENPSFKHFDNLDYPSEGLLRNRDDVMDSREMSLISMDSAFNEMRECDLCSSIDNLSA